jgi:hypothetical protein
MRICGARRCVWRRGLAGLVWQAQTPASVLDSGDLRDPFARQTTSAIGIGMKDQRSIAMLTVLTRVYSWIAVRPFSRP